MEQVQRKLLNSPDRCVDEALAGIVVSNDGLALLRGHRVVVRTDLEALRGRVALVSGGGSGHEPAHAGYVGAGMLSAAVAGSVFASPPPGSVLAAILTLWNAGVAGVLLIVKNYTGDRLNFGLALEQARARGVPIAMVIVADDCAFACPSKAGRRGLCGTVLVHKLAGALAQEGRPLEDIADKVTEAIKGIGTLGVSLSPCSVPGCQPSFHLPLGEMELGLGIHGEPGIKRSKLACADEVVKTMIDHMTDPSSQSHLPLSAGDSVVLCVNNLGALSCLEMGVVTRAAMNCLEGRDIRVTRVMSGVFMTSLEMTGVSLTVMRVNQETLRLFDAKTTAPAWPNLGNSDLSGRRYTVEPPQTSPTEKEHVGKEGPLSDTMRNVLEKVSSVLLSKQEELNALDRAAGDGDCGNTHALAARAFQNWLGSHRVPGCPGQLLSVLAGLVQEQMGGSSGALYSLFLTAAAPSLWGRSDPAAWADAMHAGTEAMRRYGGADPGDRTMLDALCPAVEELQKLTSAPLGGEMAILQAAVKPLGYGGNQSLLQQYGHKFNPGQAANIAGDTHNITHNPIYGHFGATTVFYDSGAESGADSTREMTASAGRASYVASQHLTQPDPGAVAVALIFRTVFTAMGGSQ